jgi:4-carboxymuconolactone decarboxylase
VSHPAGYSPEEAACHPPGARGMLGDMTDTGRTRAQQLLGDTAPDLVRLTDDVLFGEVWANPGLSPRDRSLVTVAALVSLYRTDQLGSHLRRALDNGLSKEELVHAITHLAFYAGWPNAMTAITQLKQVTEG